MNHPQHGQLRGANRRPLICGLIAAVVLCLGALLPSASGSEGGAPGSGADGGGVSPVVPGDQPVGVDGGTER